MTESLPSSAPLRGTLHVFAAFDWGEEVDLDHARRLLPAEDQALARRPRTPSSIAYRPAPLRYTLDAVRIELPELGAVEAKAEAIVFDFGGVSISLIIPFALAADALARLAAWLADPQPLIAVARSTSAGLFRALQPAIQQAAWSTLSEEYIVFEFPPGDSLGAPAQLVEQNGPWLAGLIRLESEPLSSSEVNSALQTRISYSPQDMLVADWSAAVLIDQDCEETLQAIEFANLQLLEYRYIDDLLDQRLTQAYTTIHRTLRKWLPFWRTQARPLRQLGELRIDANSLFERTGNALKMVGDQYLARVYHMIASRFRLSDWEQSIRRSLDVVEGAYQVVSDQSATFRIELLELIIVVLIVVEIVMALVRH